MRMLGDQGVEGEEEGSAGERRGIHRVRIRYPWEGEERKRSSKFLGAEPAMRPDSSLPRCRIVGSARIGPREGRTAWR